ncbi:MAG: hypothetical protein GX589_05050, partial [Deltaproteobacteria bacterium]|nr:hypothetical protein [Deltaproteobacteria bacterium]
MFKRKYCKNGGYALVAVMILLSLGLVLASGMIESSGSNTKTRAVVNTQSNYYYQVEDTLNRIVGWLQANNKNLVTAFTAANFDANFRTGKPSLGDNEGEHFGVPTMIKMPNGTSSVMLSNNSFFGQAAFPVTTNLDTGSTFDAVSAFQNADLGTANARVILTWARHTNGNYQPIFRADVITGNNPDRGVHTYSYIYSQLVASSPSVGFFGRDYVKFQTPNNVCNSYQYTLSGGTWSKGAPRSNCPINSNGAITVGGTINGTASTNMQNGIVLSGGRISGAQCAQGGCHNMTLPTFSTWDEYCPGNTTDVTVNSNKELPNGGCYRDISIANKKTLSLSDTENPYYFRKLNFNANFAKFDLKNVPAGKQVVIYVQEINNNHINGNQFYNPTHAPNMLKINYIGTNPLTLNGTADINCQLVAPLINVSLKGNFNFYGGIMAQSIDMVG